MAIDVKQINGAALNEENIGELLRMLIAGTSKDIVRAEPDLAHMFLQSPTTKFKKGDYPSTVMPNVSKTAVVTLSDGTTREYDIEFEHVWTAASNNPKPVYHAAPGVKLDYHHPAKSDEYGAYIDVTWYLKIPNTVPCGITDSHGLASGKAKIYSADANRPAAL
jgi:hypothetical protein